MYRRKFIKNGLLFITGSAAFGIITPRKSKAGIYFPPEQFPAAAGPYNPYPPSAWWLLNSNGLDSSGNGATLSFTGAQTYVTGQNGVPNSAYTIGGGSYASVTAPACNNWTTFSLSFWFYETTCGPQFGRFWEKGANSEITASGVYANSGDCDTVVIQNLGGNTAAIQDNAISQNAWYHYVATFDFPVPPSGPLTFYINGVQIGTSLQNTVSSTTNSIYLGTYGGSPGSYQMIGYLQDIRFWNNLTITQAQVTALYNAGAASVA